MRFVAIMVVLVISFGCSTANDNAPSINPVTGKHPKGWVDADTGGLHPSAYYAGPSACYECHGKNMAGGISGVSCFSTSYNGVNCHPGGPGNHPAGWSAPTAHGASAKAPSLGRDGLIHCQSCHGSDYAGGSSSKSCINTAGCHGAGVMAPHSPKPWRSKIGGRTHTSTDASNAAACASCHTNGANSSRQPSPAAPAGTPLGCFNNTLCHGVAGHPQGWELPSNHGAAALAPAGGDKGFAACSTCHGAQYDGGTALQSCLNTSGCHTVNAPHPPKPWRSETSYSHTKCDPSNSGECAKCHANGANSSLTPNPDNPKGLTGCFDNTLCHGTIGHDSGWVDPAQHGAEAKKAPTSSTGFSSCQKCHGVAFINGDAVTCFNGLGCHGFGVNAPHPAKPWYSGSATGLKHTTTDPANAGTCAICHTAGANSTVKPPSPATNTLAGCFNNTLCHFHQIPYAPSATVPTALHSGEAKKDLTVCQACHGVTGSTNFDGLALADGTKTTACSACHTYAKAHPTDWQGEGPYSHRSAGNKATACALCHDVRQGATAPLAASPSCFSATFKNSLGQTRTCHPNGPGAAPHSVPYNNHNATARSNFSYCLGCHQIARNNTVPPGCMNCHLADPQQSPNNCVSCHSKPPNSTVYPNVGSSHATHNALNVADLCAECHSGLGLGTVDHQNRAKLRTASVQANPVAFGTLARTGGLNPSYSAAACLNTYCHGGSLVGGSNKAPQWGQSGYLQGCGVCHGFPPAISAHTNVTAVTSCAGCHQHVNSTNNGFTDPTKHINGKVEAIAGAAHAFPYPGALHATAGSNVSNCSGCHNTTDPGSYPVASGVAPNCRACHISSLGVGCTDCHATPPNGTVAPNRNLSHTPHNAAATMVAIACSSCHQGGGSGSLTHGYGTTTVAFDAFVKTGGLTPAYNTSSKQCTNTYCHGATVVGGSNKSPQWGQSGYNQGCGTCHGFPPAISAHNGLTSASPCSGCHQHVNATNTGFVDVTKHINGQIDVTAGASHAYPYPGSLHATAGATPSNCSGCHDTTSAGSYPVASGTAPNCRSCHLAGLGTGCSDCHGDAATGRPNVNSTAQSAFPTRRGQHQREDHINRACTVCHPFTTGSASHGWSNGQKSTEAQVGGSGTSINTWNTTTNTCTATCHGSENWY